MKLFNFFGLLFLAGCAGIAPNSLQHLDPSIKQTILVQSVGTYKAVLTAWQRVNDGWYRIYKTSAVIGRNGLASFGAKKEGDGQTPSGVYPLGPAFGYAPSMKTGLDYRQATENDFWVDDVNSPQYNQWVKGKPQAVSFEHMKRDDILYSYGAIISYNLNPIVFGAGSAIFMHIWRGYNKPTAGCVALNQRHLRKILHWLDKKLQPVIILE